MKKIYMTAAWALALCLSVSCSEPQKQKKPEETRSSLLNLRPLGTADSCTLNAGTYQFDEPGENGAPAETKMVSLQLSDLNGDPSKPHLIFSNESDQNVDFFTFLYTELFLDSAGFLADGQPRDKAEPFETGVRLFLNMLRTTAGLLALDAAGFDFDEEIRNINLDDITVGYVAGCERGETVLHLVIDDTGVKMKFKQIADSQIQVRGFIIADGGKLEKDRLLLEKVNDQVFPPATVIQQLRDIQGGLGDRLRSLFD